MTTNDKRKTTRREWPAYLEPLRPDEITCHRMRKGVLGAAEALLATRTRSWFDVTATWSSVLAPLAAGLLVVFGALAYRASARTADSEIAIESASAPVGLVSSLAPDAQALPALLTNIDDPSRDDMLAALLIAER